MFGTQNSRYYSGKFDLISYNVDNQFIKFDELITMKKTLYTY